MMYGYYSEMSDSELWSLFLSGDKKALSYIYKNQYHQLLSYGIKLYPDYEVVRDCIQDLFVKLYLNHKKLSPTLNINAYLLRSLKNRLYDVLSDKKDISSLDETLAFDFTIDEEFFLQWLQQQLAQWFHARRNAHHLDSHNGHTFYDKYNPHVQVDSKKQFLNSLWNVGSYF